jgi:DNA-binding NarL/FixJ family response regulator
VLVLTATPDPRSTRARQGADAVLDKMAGLGEVVQAVRSVLAGQRPVHPATTSTTLIGDG